MKTHSISFSVSKVRAVILVVAITSMSVATCLVAAPGGNGGGGKKGGAGFYTRADFVDADVNLATAEYRVVSDGLIHTCNVTPNDHPTGATWDYWSKDDPELSFCERGGGQNDVQSNGGRWIFSSGWGDDYPVPGERSVRINWKGALVSPGPDWAKYFNDITELEAPNLDVEIQDESVVPHNPEADPDPTVDNLHVRIAADDLFQPGTTRHRLEIEIFEPGVGRSWAIEYRDLLYVTQDNPTDPEVVIITTKSPGGSDPDVPLADLIHRVKGPDNTIGTYSLPVAIIVRKTDIPVQ